jgi:hypothetical protein
MESASDRIEISTDKKRAVLLILILIGANLILLALGRTMAIALAALSAIAVIYVLVTAFKKNYGLVIDNNGITDNVSKIGLIQWSDIEDIKIIKLKGLSQEDSPPRLAIYVRNPKDYLYSNRGRGSLSQSEAESLYDKYGTPILINYALLKHKGVELQEILLRELERRFPTSHVS